MKQPFFSIIIPTKNRPELLRDAILSVLLQDFDDYELIVSDDYNDGRTADVVNEFKNDKHLNYVRTDKELNMPDHWEFATEKANGIYIMILTNRSFLRQGSLRDIYDSISRSQKNVLACFWSFGHYDEKSKVLIGEKEQAGDYFLKSKDLAKNFSRTLSASFLPKPCYGCYKRDLGLKIKNDIGRLYFPSYPDYTSALLLLAYTDSVMYIPRTLFFFQGQSLGNVLEPYINTLDPEDLYHYVPIKAPIGNSVAYNDFLAVRDITGNKLKDIDIDWVFYFTTCFQELKTKMKMPGIDKKDQMEILKLWNKTLSSFDKETQTAVWKRITREYGYILKSYLKSSILGSFLFKTKLFFKGKPTQKYQNALMAGGFSNYKEYYL